MEENATPTEKKALEGGEEKEEEKKEEDSKKSSSQDDSEHNAKVLNKNEKVDLFTVCEILEPRQKDQDFMQSQSIPYLTEVVTLGSDLKWSDIVWGEKTVEFGEYEIGPLLTCKFVNLVKK